MNLLAGISIFFAAFLLFALEPLIAKRILPWFGGSSAVWSVCLVFYQVALLGGYAYARLSTRYLRQRQQAVLHIVLLIAALSLLPIGPNAAWKPGPQTNPVPAILELLTFTIGLPFAVLSATSPLLQDWLARSGDNQPYRFFALSNFASLAALLSYPLLIEPRFDATQQSIAWSICFGCFALACIAFTWLKRNIPNTPPQEPAVFTTMQPLWWVALSACASMLLLSVTNHIDENVAAVPLLWVLPLAVYLISFIVAFGPKNLYRRALWLRLLAFGLAMLAYAEFNTSTILPLQISIPVFLAGLFIACVFCHSELYRLRPTNSGLTAFYLWISAGGALGAIFVGLVAPQIFGGIYELPVTMTLIAALALALTWSTGNWPLRLLWTAVTGVMLVVVVLNYQAYHFNTISLSRSFYGSLRVLQSPQPGPDQVRSLFHGTIRHGEQFLLPSRRRQPTTYYGPNSGIGIVLRDGPPSPKRVAIVGLGSGTLAAYSQPGDTFRFYDINPQMIHIAQTYFTFLHDSRATIQIVEGDARLSLEREHVPPFNIIVLDAFSGDAIPVHLLTSQAMQLYAAHLLPDGVIAFHISNNFLDLTPIVCGLAAQAGFQFLAVKNEDDDENGVFASDWVLVTKNKQVLLNPNLEANAREIPKQQLRLWTDDFSSLLPILKTPEIQSH